MAMGLTHAPAIHKQRRNAVPQFRIVRLHFQAPGSGSAVFVHELKPVVPEDQAPVSVQQFVPDTVFFPWTAANAVVMTAILGFSDRMISMLLPIS